MSLKEDLRLFFELLRDEDQDTTSRTVQMLDKGTIRRLMEAVSRPASFHTKPGGTSGKAGHYRRIPGSPS